MPEQIFFTDEHRAYLRQMRDSGVSWDDCAIALGWSRCTARKLALEMHLSRARLQQAKPIETVVTDRPPLPAMHPDAWRIICSGLGSFAGELA